MLATGVQAVLRALLEQHRLDRRAGLDTASLVSGYQGSPLAAFDVELTRHAKLAAEHQIVHIPGLNEELGATAVWGSQVADRLSEARYDGVVGVWYGKAPGLDRAGDAIRHGNWVGTTATGGVLALVGDDPSSKSSTLPSASEAALADFGIPTLYPGSPQEVLEYALHGVALSRACGVWSALKLVTNVADGFGTVHVAPDLVHPRLPDRTDPPFSHEPHADLLAPATLDLERSLVEVRLPRAASYGAANELNRVAVGGPGDWIGIAASGKTWFDVRQALHDLGLDDEALSRSGVRLIKLGMIFPLEQESVRRLCAGLEEVLVVEEKRPFVESQLREALYGSTGAPAITGKRDPAGEPLIPVGGELGPIEVARALVARLSRRLDQRSLRDALARLEEHSGRDVSPAEISRTPFFCSGCPHNRSTEAPEGSGVGVGIGCHTMVLLNPSGRGELAGVTQMGGEGAQWIGMAPFTKLGHFIQNVGDGTFHHSGSLALRFAVAAKANVTFKILFNRAVAMTGGQHVEGEMAIPELTRMLEAEGVRRTIVTTDDVGAYRGVKLARNAELRDRARLLETQRELAQIEGVTVLIHDQGCAAELRRLRKRGKAVDPEMRVVINERVCEGCGDCGEKSSCLSVQPIETEFGRKTQIHQSSCNKDYSCLEGDCPSFLTVSGAKALPPRDPGMPPVEPGEPASALAGSDVRIRLCGIGGTGVVTVNQVLGMAALIDGLDVAGLDQTGLAQKGGPVISDLHIGSQAGDRAARASAGSIDSLLVFDLLTATVPANLAVANPERTLATVSTSATATGQMVTDKRLSFPSVESLAQRISRAVRPNGVFVLDADALASKLFADTMPANMLTLGAAYQRGSIPVGAGAIEQAIRLNGAGADRNLKAFAWGRAFVADSDLVAHVLGAGETGEDDRIPTEAERELIDSIAPEGELRRLLEIRVPELIDYQDPGYARSYAEFVGRVAGAERAVAAGGSLPIAEAVARQLFKLMAYKDEYEVARLHLLELDRIRSQFGSEAKLQWNLHPPFLRSLGMKRKLRVGRWFAVVFRALRGMRRLRGSPLDLFGFAKTRRIERELIHEYRDAIEQGLADLTPANRDRLADLADLPDMIRGYEQIKLASIDPYRTALAEGIATLKDQAPSELESGLRRRRPKSRQQA